MPKKSSGSDDTSADNALRFVFEAQCPEMFALVRGIAEDFERLTIYKRGEYDILGVLKRFGPDGGPEVCFGSGPDFVSVLFALEGSLRGGKWRKDGKPPWEKSK